MRGICHDEHLSSILEERKCTDQNIWIDDTASSASGKAAVKTLNVSAWLMESELWMCVSYKLVTNGFSLP